MSTCLSDETITRFAEGVLSEQSLADVEGHIADCEECRGVVAAIAADGGGADDRRAGVRSGRYRMLAPIGAGGMGVVYAAFDTQLGRRVALKVLRGGVTRRPELAARLLREAHGLAQISHPNVITVHDVGQVDDEVFVAMELVDGPTLRAWSTTARPWRAIMTVCLQAGEGLAAAHDKGLVHRDVKPDNILVAVDGRVRVTDFGLVAVDADGAAASPEVPAFLDAMVTADGQVPGSPSYMAPEQLAGEPATAASDLFSYCVTVHEALFGERPFAGNSAHELRREIDAGRVKPPPARTAVPARVRAAIREGLAARPGDRPPTMRALLRNLEAACRSPGRRARAVALPALALLALAVGVRAHDSPRSAWRPTVEPLLPAFDEETWFPAYSPDGSALIFGSNRDGGRLRLYVAPSTGGPARAVTPQDMSVIFGRFTRNGDEITFIDITSHVYRMAVAGGPPRLLAAGPRAFADCGDRLVFAYADSPGCNDCPRLVESGGGQERERRRLPPGAVINDLSCDPAGTNVVLSMSGPERSTSDYASLVLVPLDGGELRRLTDSDDFDFQPTFHRDGKSVVFSRWGAGRANLMEVPVAGGPPAQLTFNEGESENKGADVSPDGSRVVFVNVTAAEELSGFDLADGRRRPLHSELHRLGKIVAAPEGLIAETGRYFSVSRRYSLELYPYSGGEPRVLAEGYAPAVVPDGDEVVFAVPAAGGATRIMAMPRAGGPARRLVDVAGEVATIGVAVDGTVYFAVRGPGGRVVWKVPLAGGSAEVEPDGARAVVPAPRGGARMVLAVLATGGSEARFIPAGRPLGAPTARVAYNHYVAWAADGKSIIYLKDAALRRHDFDSGEDAPLDIDVRQLSSLAVSPDGRTLWVSDRHTVSRRRVIMNFAQRPWAR